MARALRSSLWFFVGVLIAFVAIVRPANASFPFSYSGNYGGTCGMTAVNVSFFNIDDAANNAVNSLNNQCSSTNAHMSFSVSSKNATTGVVVLSCTYPPSGGFNGCTSGSLTVTYLVNGVYNTSLCSGGSASSAMTYDFGTTAAAADSAFLSAPMWCVGGCMGYLDLSGTTKRSSWMVGSVRHYGFAGRWTPFNGGTQDICTATSATTPPNSTATTPVDTCGANQGKVVVNGVTRCYDYTTGKPADADPTQKTTTGSPVQTTNPDNTISCTVTTTYADGTKSTAVTTQAAGTTCPSTPPTTQTCSGPSCSSTGQPQTSGGGGSGSGPTTNNDPGSMGNYCTAHPNAAGCKDAVSPGSDMAAFCAANPNAGACKTTSPGTAVGIDSLYTETATDTNEGLVNAFMARMQNAPVVQSAIGFWTFSMPAGDCSSLDGSFSILGQSISVQMSPWMCGSMATSIYSMLSLGLAILGLVAAWSIAFL